MVIASSSGGIKALIQVISTLPANFPAAIAVVQHLHASRLSGLAEVLQWHARLAVQWAQPSDRLRRGTVYLAPPDC